MSTELVMLPISSSATLFSFSLYLSSFRVFSNELALCRWPKYQSFSFSISPSCVYSGLISFRTDWFDLLVVQGTLKSLLHYSPKASILGHTAFFRVQFSHPCMTTGKTIALIRWTFVGKEMSLLFNMLSRLVIVFFPRSRSDQITRSVVSDSLGPHESQHARPPCPSPTPGVHSDSRPLSQWCHPAISSSVKHLLISWLPSPSAVTLEPKKIKSVPLFPHLFAMNWWDRRYQGEIRKPSSVINAKK